MRIISEVSRDEVTEEMLEKARSDGVETVWDRFEEQQPQCGFGRLGLCCRNCNMGPCRIDPFGEGPTKGTCGATASTIVSRNLLRMVAAGAAAHSDHGREIALTFKEMLDGKAPGYDIKDGDKLESIAAKLGVETEGEMEDIAREVVDVILKDFGTVREEGLVFTRGFAPESLLSGWEEAEVTPRGIDREIVEIMHRTHMGVDADPLSLNLQGVRAALSDGWGGSFIATELSDVLFGTPEPIESKSNLGVLEENQVNIITHGHVPLLSEKILEASQDEEMINLAEENGAEGINVVGMCCTGLELLMRQGVPQAGNFLQQELAIATGSVDAMVVDYQCIMPSLPDVADCYHTKVITTSEKAKIPGATHIEFDPAESDEIAKKIVREAVENFPNRVEERVDIPEGSMEGLAGFSVEAILGALGGSLDPLLDSIKEGKVKGVAGLVGCNNPKVKHDHSHVTLAKRLIENDILVVGGGCWATAAMKAGLFRPEAAEMAGDGLKAVCEQLNIPPCLNMGSCVDNTRILRLIGAVAEALDVHPSKLPVAGAAPEWMSEKAVSIGTYFVSTGVFTVLGTPPPVLGSDEVVKLLTEDVEEVTGGKFAVETDPEKMAELIIDHIERKREELLG